MMKHCVQLYTMMEECTRLNIPSRWVYIRRSMDLLKREQVNNDWFVNPLGECQIVETKRWDAWAWRVESSCILPHTTYSSQDVVGIWSVRGGKNRVVLRIMYDSYQFSFCSKITRGPFLDQFGWSDCDLTIPLPMCHFPLTVTSFHRRRKRDRRIRFCAFILNLVKK